MSNKLVCCRDLRLLAETENAIKVAHKDLRRDAVTQQHQKWIPMSLISHNTFNGIDSIGEVEIPQWVADQRDIDYDEE